MGPILTIQLPLWLFLLAWGIATGIIIYFAWFAGNERNQRTQMENNLLEAEEAFADKLKEIDTDYSTVTALLEEHTQRLSDLEKRLEEHGHIPANMVLLPLSAVPWAAESEQVELDPEWVNDIEELDDL